MSREQRSRSGSIKIQKTPRPSPASQIQIDAPAVAVEGEVAVVLTQTFCPSGHNLIQPGHAQFDGQPGIRLRIVDGDRIGEVTLSPIHGDYRKQEALVQRPAPGTRLSIRCPQCDAELPLSGDCAAGDGGRLRVLYLTPKLDEGHAALVCDVWGCPYSKIVDEWSLLSEVVLQETGGR